MLKFINTFNVGVPFLLNPNSFLISICWSCWSNMKVHLTLQIEVRSEQNKIGPSANIRLHFQMFWCYPWLDKIKAIKSVSLQCIDKKKAEETSWLAEAFSNPDFSQSDVDNAKINKKKKGKSPPIWVWIKIVCEEE